MWIEQGVPLNEELVSALEAVSANKSNAQTIRHKAFALAKRWYREQQKHHTIDKYGPAHTPI